MSTTFPKLTNQTRKRIQKDGNEPTQNEQTKSSTPSWNENDTDEVIREDSIFADHESDETEFEVDGEEIQNNRKFEYGSNNF